MTPRQAHVAEGCSSYIVSRPAPSTQPGATPPIRFTAQGRTGHAPSSVPNPFFLPRESRCTTAKRPMSVPTSLGGTRSGRPPGPRPPPPPRRRQALPFKVSKKSLKNRNFSPTCLEMRKMPSKKPKKHSGRICEIRAKSNCKTSRNQANPTKKKLFLASLKDCL